MTARCRHTAGVCDRLVCDRRAARVDQGPDGLREPRRRRQRAESWAGIIRRTVEAERNEHALVRAVCIVVAALVGAVS